MSHDLESELRQLLKDSVSRRVSSMVVHAATRDSLDFALRISGRTAWSTPSAPVSEIDTIRHLAPDDPASSGESDDDDNLPPAGAHTSRPPPSPSIQGTTPNGHAYYVRRWWVSIFGYLEFIALSNSTATLTESQCAASESVSGLIEDIIESAIESKNLFLNVYHEVLHQLLPLTSDVMTVRNRLAPAIVETGTDNLLRRLEASAQAATFSCENVVRYLSQTAGTANYYRSQLSKPRMALVSLTQLVAEATDQFRHLADARGIELRFDGATAGDVQIKGDAFHIKRLLYNLLNNAVKYSYKSSDARHGGRTDSKATHRYIDVEMIPRYSPDRAETAIVFENFGVGLAPEEVRLVTRPGYRGTLARREGIRGCGVGLSEVADIARMHGGRLKIRARPASASIPDGPSLFTVHAIFPTTNPR